MSDNANNAEGTERPPQRSLNFEALKLHVLSHKIEVALWATRIFTVIFTLGYFIPIFGNAHSSYYKALLSNAATSALRLHQRLGTVQFTRQFVAQLLTEDSCHYLFYSLIFIYVAPITWVLLPVFLFGVLHSASYSLTLLDSLGHNAWWGARLLISLVEFQSRNILRIISMTEIVLMPICIILVLKGKAGLLTPFIYYHFLVQRYTSRRNPYTRNMFHEIRVLLESTAHKPNMPTIVRSVLLGIVNFATKLAPPQIPVPPSPTGSQ
ncbi:hypothetical protein RN001_003863 [Aquatica leii]|uniref:Uncharacterized protein n=1 Tax=Aquatica leii TaxID=1421715 RepID=A0AAN7PIX8_9COLE|nr:hypothetical protein RN001_003863 [Aquatica leii]